MPLIEMNTSEIYDRLEVLRRKENTTYKCNDYIKMNARMVDYGKGGSHTAVDENCRAALCKWCFKIVDYCKLQRETVVVAMSNLDRFMCTSRGKNSRHDRRKYQLVVVASLYTAVKMRETVQIDVRALSKLSQGVYTENEIILMERSIIEALGWRLNGPTPLSFVHNFIDLLPASMDPCASKFILDVAQKQTELAIADYELSVLYLPSEIALAAILNAVNQVDVGILPMYERKQIFSSFESSCSGSAINSVRIRSIQMRLNPLFFRIGKSPLRKNKRSVLTENTTSLNKRRVGEQQRHAYQPQQKNVILNTTNTYLPPPQKKIATS